MMSELQITAILDACVLYPAPIRDLLLYLADAGLYQPKWTEKIHEEWTRNLLLKRPDLTVAQLQRTTEAMNKAFPDATTEGYEALIQSLELPDPDDCHVLAAAIRSRAQVIVTANIKDFPADYLGTFNVEAQHPDFFIIGLLETNPSEVVNAFRKQVASLKKPPKKAIEVIETLRKASLIKTADALESMLQ